MSPSTPNSVSVRVLHRNRTNRTLEKKTYFKELAHAIVRAGDGRVQNVQVGWPRGHSERSSFHGALLQKSFFFGGDQFFLFRL